MGFNVTKVYGKTDTWIGFLGSYIGSIISGFVTLFGVMLSLKFTKYEAMKDKLPEKIEHLEECIDFIDENIDRLSVLERVDVSEMARPLHWRTTKLYHLDHNYNFTPKKNQNIDTTIGEYLKSSEKTIRKHLIKVNAEAHVRHKQFSRRLKRHYDISINPIEQRVENFQSTIMDEYMKTHADVITNGYLVRIDLTDEHRTMLDIIIRDLHLAELKYLDSVIDTYDDFKDDLLDILGRLTKKLDY